MCGGFVLGDSEVRTLSHSTVSDTLLLPSLRNLIRKSARHLATTSIDSFLPSSALPCKVERGTLKIAPRFYFGSETLPAPPLVFWNALDWRL